MVMNKRILVRYEEIFLKGLNKHTFEARLIQNIRSSLAPLAKVKISKSQSRIYIESEDPSYDQEEVLGALSRIFGIASVSLVDTVETDLDKIREGACLHVRELIDRKGFVTFKVEAKRGDKTFPLNSPQLCADLGSYLLDKLPVLKVDVHHPDFILYVEVREATHIYSEIIQMAKGLPTGSGGKATLLLSGGIDSPVAGWMVAKRGVTLDAVYFHSHPYTSERAKEKVVKLAEILGSWCMGINLYVVPFTEIQLLINEKCPADYLTIIMRRYMMRIAEKIALREGSLALVTGEAIGQVASQTMESMLVTNSVCTLPVYRPLVGMDKNEVIEKARKIDTFETSILPYEDCCTLFTAKHPVTRPSLAKTIAFEKVLEEEALIQAALDGTELIKLPGR